MPGVSQEAIGNESLYVFGELLDLPVVAAMAADGSLGQTYKLLELFAYGKLADLKTTAGLPALTPAQVRRTRRAAASRCVLLQLQGCAAEAGRAQPRGCTQCARGCALCRVWAVLAFLISFGTRVAGRSAVPTAALAAAPLLHGAGTEICTCCAALRRPSSSC